MTKYIFYIIFFFITLTVQAQITMTTQKEFQCVVGEIEGKGFIDTTYLAVPVHIGIESSGYISIDWGDGTKIKMFKFKKVPLHFYHNYYDTIQYHKITIRSRNITELDCSFNELTSLDISRNAKLKGLRCTHNQLTSLNLSRNTKLEWLVIENNLLSSDSLNFLFETLPNNKSSEWKNITIDKNPGVYDCETCIAEKKRWSIYGKPLGLRYGQPIDSKIENECE